MTIPDMVITDLDGNPVDELTGKEATEVRKKLRNGELQVPENLTDLANMESGDDLGDDYEDL